MPLVGTICCQTGEPASFDHCKKASRQGVCEHPLPLIAAMSGETERRDGIDISSTTLSSCPRQHVLKQRNDYYEDPDDYYARWMGSFSHHAIEHGGPWDNIVQERRFARPIDVYGMEFVVSGMPDWYDRETQTVDDYKFVGWPPRELRAEHEAQANVYAWLLDFHGYPVKSGRVIYLHQKSRHTGKRKTIFPVPIWQTTNVETYIRDKLVPHGHYRLDGNIARLRIADEDKWKAQFCPFRSGCNPGQCCTPQDAPVASIKTPVGDVDPGW